MYKLKEAVLSSKCQITIPKAIRDILNINSGESVAFYIEGNDVVLTSLKNLNISLKDKRCKTSVKKEKNHES